MLARTVTPDVAAPLLSWYDRHARQLPWRVGPKDRARGVKPDPYRVWLSEVMLQQTTVAAVGPYFAKFIRMWPTVSHLAGAPVDEVMRAWAGLGYYARARNLKTCAEAVVRDYGGRFPRTAAELQSLPGVGPYTAAAIAAIAFDEPVAVVDGNVERVIARLFAIAVAMPAAKAAIRERQAELTPSRRPGDYAQAMMDLGATICTPARPACSLCPLADPCLARASGNPELYPLKAPKAVRPTRYGTAFVAVRGDGAILLRRRPDTGLLGGMAEVPGTEWSFAVPDPQPPFAARWKNAGKVVHVFTHFRLELSVQVAVVSGRAETRPSDWWSAPETLPHEALPSVMKKAIEAARPGSTLKR
jgi:A/G-specific adenine glycosylase